METLKQKSDFEEIIKGGPVLIDFYADWCGPCKMMESIIEETEENHKDLRIVKVNTDNFMSIARDNKIMTIPAFKIFEKGKVIKEKTGFMTRTEFEEFLNN